MVEFVQDIKPTGIASGYVEVPFNRAKKFLESKGYQIITAEQNADLRIKQGKGAKVSTWGNYVREGVLYVPEKGRFITRGSLVMAYPKEATKAHKNGKEFYVAPEQAEAVIGDSVKVPYNVSLVPTNKFGEDAVTTFLFGKVAQKYGEFLKEVGIKQMPLYFNDESYVDSQKKPYANQLWLARVDDLYNSDVNGSNLSVVVGNYGSNVSGDIRYLDDDDAVRGVCLDAEGVAPLKNAPKSYTLDQISRALKAREVSGLESSIAEFLQANN